MDVRPLLRVRRCQLLWTSASSFLLLRLQPASAENFTRNRFSKRSKRVFGDCERNRERIPKRDKFLAGVVIYTFSRNDAAGNVFRARGGGKV